MTEIDILDRGFGASQFGHFTDQIQKLMGANIIFTHRTNLSERFLYRHWVSLAVKRNCYIILTSPHRTPSILKPQELFRSGDWQRDWLKPGHIYQFHSKLQSESAEFLSRANVKLGEYPLDNPLIFLVDIVQKIDLDFEKQIREILRDSTLTNLKIWLHIPLHLIPLDIISLFGNVISMLPTESEIELLSYNLPVSDTPYSTYTKAQLTRGILGFGYDLKGNNDWFFYDLRQTGR